MVRTTEQLKQAVSELSPEQYDEFRAWFLGQEQEMDDWDRQMEADSNAGKLDHLAEQALRAYEEGRTTPL